MTAEIRIDGYRLSESDADALRSVLAVGIRKTDKFLKIMGDEISPEHRNEVERKCTVVKRLYEIINEGIDENLQDE